MGDPSFETIMRPALDKQKVAKADGRYTGRQQSELLCRTETLQLAGQESTGIRYRALRGNPETC